MKKKDSTKSILHLSTLPIWDLGKGKGRVSTYLPLKGMVDAGYKMIYITNSNRQKSCNEDGIEIKHITTVCSENRVCIQLFLFPITTLLFIINSLFLCKYFRPSIIYAHSIILALPAYILSRIYKAKYVLRLYGIGKGAKRPWSPSGILLRIAFLIKTDCYILTNDGTNAKSIAVSFGVDESKIHFLRNGINKNVDLICDDSFKKELAPNGEIILLSVSRLVNWKHVDDMIRLMVPLKQKQVNFKLVIVGDGPERKNLELLCKQLNLSDSVTFVGAVEQKDVFKYNLVSDIFISLNELSSMSNPVFEAMLTGSIVIALNRGNTENLICDGKNGILIQTTSQLPNVIERIISDYAKSEEIGKRAHKFIIENWPSWEERVNNEINILDRIN